MKKYELSGPFMVLIFFLVSTGIVIAFKALTLSDYKKTCEPIMSADQRFRWIECDKQFLNSDGQWVTSPL